MNKISALLVVLVCSLAFISCTDDEVTSPPPALTIISSSGTVNISEIGGTNLTVQSYFKENSPVSSGQYVTDVSTKGTQLLFITDGARQVRGLTLSTLSGSNPSIMECNALSTAYALLFLTPGICTSRSEYTSTRIAILNQLNSFSQLVAHLRSNLLNSSLNVLIANQQTQLILRTCIDEFIAADTSSVPSKRDLSAILSDPNFLVTRTTSTQVKLTNYNWRYVNVLRRDIRFDGVEKLPIQNISSDMGGGVPYSLGTVFAWIRAGFQPFPTILNDGATIPADATKSEYWAIGPGKALGDIPPQSVTQRMNLIQPYTSTILFYILFPVIDIVTGGSMFGDVNLGQIMTEVRQAAEAMQQSQDVINAVTGVINAPDDVLATSEALATAVEVVFVGFVSNPIFYEGILTSAQAALLLKVYGFLIGVTSAANVTIVAILYHITPTISKYMVESWIPVLMSPQNGYVTSTLTPTMSCYPIGEVGATYNFQIAKSNTFVNPAVDANSSSSQYQVLQGALSSNQQYYWRVNATVSGQNSVWSEIWSFTTGSGSLSQLYDDFASSANLSNWVMSGNPQPVWVSSAFGKSGLFDNNGDSWYTSSGYSTTLVGSTSGFTIESEIYMNVTNPAGCWIIPGIGLTMNTNPTPIGSTGDLPMGISLSLTYEGDACWGTPSQYQRHSYFWIGVYAEDGTSNAPAGSYDLNGDTYANGWHVMKIVVGSDRYVKFYCDNNLIWSSTKKLHPSLMTNRNAVLGFRSSGSAGKSYHDWVRVTTP